MQFYQDCLVNHMQLKQNVLYHNMLVGKWYELIQNFHIQNLSMHYNVIKQLLYLTRLPHQKHKQSTFIIVLPYQQTLHKLLSILSHQSN